MKALITIPPTIEDIPVAFTQVGKDLYYNEEATTFYKLTIIDPVTIFLRNDALNRQNFILTPFDPRYLVLQKMASK